jgi:hypothetical protein
MMTLQKSVEEPEEGKAAPSEAPVELISSIGSAAANQLAKSISGFAIIYVTQKLHKIAIRTLTTGD